MKYGFGSSMNICLSKKKWLWMFLFLGTQTEHKKKKKKGDLLFSKGHSSTIPQSLLNGLLQLRFSRSQISLYTSCTEFSRQLAPPRAHTSNGHSFTGRILPLSALHACMPGSYAQLKLPFCLRQWSRLAQLPCFKPFPCSPKKGMKRAEGVKGESS